jgi:spore maturation protein CgeB
MKILVVGDGSSEIHEVAVAAAFSELGHDVSEFYWTIYFKSKIPLWREFLLAQNKFLLGGKIRKLNADLFKAVINLKPKLIFIYRGTHITPETIIKIKSALPDCIVFGYNNDDPFSVMHPRWLWRHFLKSIPHYDIVFAYRHHNLEEFRHAGAKRVELLRSWFLPQINKVVELSSADKTKFSSDVVFVGHYENDGRIEYLEEIVKYGYKLRLFGPGYEWNHRLAKSKVLRHLAPIDLVWGDKYNLAISGSKIALCFFSKLNRDTYTRRCFEIPAAKTLLLSEYSEDCASLYRAGEEADFFTNKEELISKLYFYLSNDNVLKQVSEMGYKRVISDGHDIVSRMRLVLDFVGD